MAEKNKNQIKIGMILSYVNLVLGNLIPFFYTPIMLDLLGQNEYGLYKLAGSATSYLSLVALGIGGAISRYLIKARKEGGKEEEEKIFGFFFKLFQYISIITLIVGTIITLNLGLVYSKSLTPEELNRMKVIVALMTVNTAIGFSATSYNSVASSHERFLFIQVTNILSTVGVPIINLIILYCGFKSIGMAVVSLVINILIRCMYILYVRRIMHIKPIFTKIDKNLLKEIFIFSFWIFVSNVVGQLYNSTDVVIIGAIPKLATSGTAIYSIGTTFSNIMFSIAEITPTLFTPKTTKMVFDDCSNSELTNLVIKIGRIQAFMVTLICSGFIVFGKPFIQLYAGNGFEEAYWIAIIIMLPNCIPLVQSVAHAIIRAKNMHRFRSIVYLFIAIANIVGTVLLVNKYGVIGAAIPTGGALLIGQGFIMNWYYWKRVKLDIPRFWKSVVPIFSVGLSMGIASHFIVKKFDMYNIVVLLSGIVIYTFIYGIINWFLTMNKEEKHMIIEPIKNIFKKAS